MRMASVFDPNIAGQSVQLKAADPRLIAGDNQRVEGTVQANLSITKLKRGSRSEAVPILHEFKVALSGFDVLCLEFDQLQPLSEGLDRLAHLSGELVVGIAQGQGAIVSFDPCLLNGNTIAEAVENIQGQLSPTP